MKLTREQQIKAEENLGLVYKVLENKLKGSPRWGAIPERICSRWGASACASRLLPTRAVRSLHTLIG